MNPKPTKANEAMRHSGRKRVSLDFNWPAQPLHLVLVEPSIPPNTGNIARLSAATGSILHLVEPLGFDLSEKKLRRAGLDYWDAVDIRIHPNFEHFLEQNPTGEKYFFSTGGTKNYTEVTYAPGDYLIFGNETFGLSDALLAQHAQHLCNIPIRLDHVRSLNLSNCTALVLYEALRQLNLS